MPNNTLNDWLIYHQPSSANVPGTLGGSPGWPPQYKAALLLLTAPASKIEHLVLFIRSPTFPHPNLRYYIMQSANAARIYGFLFSTNINTDNTQRSRTVSIEGRGMKAE